ncbi:MAG TPA: FAD-dependent monooxygenase [Rhizomicrobium sp.]|jgi:2-polyprenyl-6-methoxyphenol hydroxylase-like FAD-dependent oxidoreductase
MALGDNKALLAQRNGDGHIRVYVALRVPEDWLGWTRFNFDQPAQVRGECLNLFTEWAPDILELLRASNNLFLPRPLYTFSPQQAWASQPDATLLGDAAHVMPPFTGKGANYAMLDALELADALTNGQFPDIASAIRHYDTTLLARMADAIGDTLSSQDALMAPDAPSSLLAYIAQSQDTCKT